MVFLRKLYKQVLFCLMGLPIPGYFRARLARWAGVNFILLKEDRGHVDIFMGQNVQIDSMYPEDLTIGNWTVIATGCVILTHFLNPSACYFPFVEHSRGKVTIGRGCFLGANTVVCKPVTIGDGAIIAAGSIVLHDIPPMEIWGGVPAVFLKKRTH